MKYYTLPTSVLESLEEKTLYEEENGLLAPDETFRSRLSDLLKTESLQTINHTPFSEKTETVICGMIVLAQTILFMGFVYILMAVLYSLSY